MMHGRTTDDTGGVLMMRRPRLKMLGNQTKVLDGIASKGHLLHRRRLAELACFERFLFHGALDYIFFHKGKPFLASFTGLANLSQSPRAFAFLNTIPVPLCPSVECHL